VTPRLFVVPAALNAAISVAPLVLAFWRGGWRERLVAALWVGGYLINELQRIGLGPQDRVSRGFRDVAEDVVLLAGCGFCLLRARHYWVVWATALALLSVVTDILYLARPEVTSLVHIYADDIWGYALDAAIVWGVFSARRRDAAP